MSSTTTEEMTPRARLASALIGRDVVAWIEEQHRAGVTMEKIRDELAAQTGDAVTVRTLDNWRRARREHRTQAAA